MVNITCEEPHADYLEEEVADGQVDETEQEEHTRTEVEGEHRIPRHHSLRLAMQFLANLVGHIAGASIFLAKRGNQLLEFRRRLLLLTGIVYISLEEILPEAIAFAGSLVIDFLLLLGVIQLAALLAFQEEQVNLNVIVGKPLLAAHSCKT